MEKIKAYLEEQFEKNICDLIDLSKIPSISSDPKEKGAMQKAALWIEAKMKNLGLDAVEILNLAGAPPYIYAEKIIDPNLPTLLLYSHYDVQPIGNLEFWESPPFEPEQREGRLFGRGCVDDKAGFIQHIAAVDAYLQCEGTLPLNLKFIIEGEEEIGSEHLGDFLDLHQQKLQADILLLTDTANLELGLPSLTYRLRGIADLDLEVKVLEHPVHSGMWGGPVTDALTAMSRILASLSDDDGKVLIPGFYDDVIEIDEIEKARLEKLPFDESKFRSELSSVPSLKWSGEEGYSVYEKIWCRPCVSIVGIDAPQVSSATNRIVEKARAKISIRTVTGQDSTEILKKTMNYLAEQAPLGVEVTVSPGAAGPSWKSNASGSVFDSIEKALEFGYGKAPVYIGCGGSIPFVNTLSKALGNIPAILLGLEDPLCKAHAENESVDLGDLKKGMISLAYFFNTFKSKQ